MAHKVTTEARGGRTVYTLHDEASGAHASILPSFGFNLFDLSLPVAGEVRRIVVAADDWADNPRSAGRNGIPVLFPYPNRVRAGKFSFEGRSYELPVNLGPNAIHGFAIDVPWEVVNHGTDDGGAFITGRYQISKQSPGMLSHWPTDATLELRYQLSGRALRLTATVANPTAHDLPYGFGIHPYFQTPLSPRGDLKRSRVVVPASRYWVLDEFLPTGERKAVDARLDFRNGQPIQGLALDDVLTGLAFDGDQCTCRLIDDTASAEFRLSFDRSFREVVMYTPPDWPGVISLEPYTQTTDAINLEGRGVDAGLRRLKHGEHATMTIRMETVG
jgi:aldose 1-epimerase